MEDDIQEFKRVLSVWNAVNSVRGMSLSEYVKTEEEKPRNYVSVRLDTVRYWTDILVKDEKGRLEDWYPFWWRSKKQIL